MNPITPRPPIIDTIPQESSRISQFNRWLFSDYTECNLETVLKVISAALLIFSVIGYFGAIGVLTLMDLYEGSQKPEPRDIELGRYIPPPLETSIVRTPIVEIRPPKRKSQSEESKLTPPHLNTSQTTKTDILPSFDLKSDCHPSLPSRLISSEELSGAFGTTEIAAIYERLQNEKRSLPSSTLELGLHAILSSTAISFKEKYELVKEAEALFKEVGYNQGQEFFIPIRFQDRSLEVPFSLLETSSILKSLLISDSDEPYLEEAPAIVPTRYFSFEDFEKYLPLLGEQVELSFDSFGPWLKAFSIAHYLDCSRGIMNKIADARPALPTQAFANETFHLVPLALINSILNHDMSEETKAEILAPLVADYIRTEWPFHNKYILYVLEALKSLKGFVELAKTLPIELNLSARIELNLFTTFYTNVYLSQQELNEIITLFPCIRGLDLSGQENLTIPSKIIPNLRKLIITTPNMTLEFPKVEALPNLEIISLQNPIGFTIKCPNLKEAFIGYNYNYRVEYAEDLFDNSPHLEVLWVSKYENGTVRAPLNCPKLKTFWADVYDIDLSNLNNHPSIESITVSYYSENEPNRPSGCPNLRVFEVQGI